MTTKRKAHRTYEALMVLAVCVGAAVLGFALGNSHTVVAKNPRALPQKSDEKIIQRKSFSNEPFGFDGLSVKKAKIAPSVKFNARLTAESGGGPVEDWVENLGFTIKNTSNKRMIYINVELDFPETAVNGHPLMVYDQLSIGIHPTAFGDALRHAKPLALEPGDTTTASLSSDRLRLLKEFLASGKFQLADLTQVNIRIDHIIFDDGTKWSQGYQYKPNPAVRGGYEQINPRIQ